MGCVYTSVSKYKHIWVENENNIFKQAQKTYT